MPLRIPFKLSALRWHSAGLSPSLFPAAPLAFKPRIVSAPRFLFSFSSMHSNPDLSDLSMRDINPIVKFEDDRSFQLQDQSLIFGPLDLDDHFSPPVPWDSYDYHDQPYMSESPASPPHLYDFNMPSSSSFNPGSFTLMSGVQPSDSDPNFQYSQWLTEPECPPLDASSSPIPIRATLSVPQTPPVFHPFIEQHPFPQNASFSPSDFAAYHPLPRSISPSALSVESKSYQGHDDFVAEASVQPPSWASQMWEHDNNSHGYLQDPTSPRLPIPHSPLSGGTYRPRRPSLEYRKRTSSLGHVFQSSSAPSPVHARVPTTSKSYSRRAESVSVSDDRDATVRRKKRLSSPEATRAAEPTSSSPPTKSALQPPKLAPSAWQLYFTDWISNHQANSDRKLNVAQAAKEAGQEYATLTEAEKEPYKKRSQVLKEARERELDAYMRTLTPDDIKRENLFRTAQRKAGKSRKSNIKDPNAPKKPLSAYFMFLQRIRSDPVLVEEVFGTETETTKQSVLAAAKWRSMTDDERKPFLAQAEQEKLDYEAARRLYEEGTIAHGTSINFSILPGSPPFRTLQPIKTEAFSSESEGEGFNTDDTNGVDFYIQS